MENSEKKLGVQLLIAGVLALVFGSVLRIPAFSSYADVARGVVSFVGSGVFLASLKMVVLPLIITSICAALASAPSDNRLKQRVRISIVYYFSTMLVAVCIGLVVVSFLKPGTGLDITSYYSGSVESQPTSTGHQNNDEPVTMASIVSNFIPTNIFRSLSDGAVLPLVVFSIILGLAIRATRSQLLTNLFEELCAVFTAITEFIIKYSPIGVFCLLTEAVAALGLDTLTSTLGVYVFAVILGLGIHALIVLPFIAKIFGRFSAYKYGRLMKTPLTMAFSTSSSSATLPVSIQTSIDEGEVDEDSARFVLPIGATINMDGTALYEGIAVVFLAQMSGIDLSFFQLSIIVFTATLAAIGAAGIPSAGLVTMVLVVQAVNGTLPADSLIPLTGLSLILAVDRPLDMIRTTVNVWGDLLGAKIVSNRIAT